MRGALACPCVGVVIQVAESPRWASSSTAWSQATPGKETCFWTYVHRPTGSSCHAASARLQLRAASPIQARKALSVTHQVNFWLHDASAYCTRWLLQAQVAQMRRLASVALRPRRRQGPQHVCALHACMCRRAHARVPVPKRTPVRTCKVARRWHNRARAHTHTRALRMCIRGAYTLACLTTAWSRATLATSTFLIHVIISCASRPASMRAGLQLTCIEVPGGTSPR